jgi:hypothetical protein
MLITKEIDKALRANYVANQTTGDGGDTKPVLKLFFPFGAFTWLITERDTENPDLLYGLCDIGQGFPEIGWVSLSELQGVRRMGLGLERDRWFTAAKTLEEYADDARAAGRIEA